MKKSRKNKPLPVLANEKRKISLFVLTHITRGPDALPIRTLYGLYKKEMGPTPLSVDGFGRMFPKHFKRGVIHAKGTTTVKGVLGVKFV